MKYKKLLSLVLAAACAASVAACAKEDNGGNGNGPAAQENVADLTQQDSIFKDGVHEYNVSESNYDLVLNGRSDYTIVYPSERDSLIDTAAVELQLFFLNATGITLPMRTDEGLTYSADAKYIVLGDSALAGQAGIEVPAERLNTNGLYIETKDSNVFLCGATDRGVINAVYEFLHQQFNWECYGTEEVVYDRNVVNEKLLNMVIVDAPDITTLSSTYGITDNNVQLANRMRYSLNAQYWRMLNNTSMFHNSFVYLPPSQYRAQYPDAYSDDRTQLCYTAHNDPETFEWMTDTISERIQQEFMQNDERHITVSVEDLSTWCTCETCTAMKNKYGTDSASVIKFINVLCEKVDAWMESDEGKPYASDYEIAFFAYHPTYKAPVNYDEATGIYTAIDDSVVLHEHAGVIYCPINATYQLPLNDPYNQEFYDYAMGWPAVAQDDNLSMWIYGTNFHWYLVPTSNYNSMQANNQLMAYLNVQWMEDQGQYNNANSTGFSSLKIYLNSKLAWNCNLDMGQLIDNYFKNYFGPAEPYVRQYFDELRAHFTYLETERNWIGNTYLQPDDQDLWPKNLLERWIGYCDQALESLAPLQESDPIMYTVYSNNVTLESISPRYLLIDLWRSKYPAADRLSMMEQFRTDCERLSITHYSERADIYSLWQNWGL